MFEKIRSQLTRTTPSAEVTTATQVEGTAGLILHAEDKTSYIIEKLLGQGGFADVYLVRDCNDQKPYAIKLLRMWDIQLHERKEIMNRFTREYECSKIDSPYLVHSRCKGTYQGNPFFTMDYCANGSLRQRIGRDMSADEIERIATDMLKGLSALHKQGVVHRDLKPENILFDDTDRSFLTDFGISGFLTSRMTIRNWLGHVKELVGTLVYMPPEQLDASRAYTSMGPVTDIFAFGIVLFEMFSGGHLPFGNDADTNETAYVDRVRNGDWINLVKYADSVPEPWLNIIQTCLQPEYAERFQATDEILALLGNRISSSSPLHSSDSEAVLRIMNGDQYGKEYPLTKLQKEANKLRLTVGWYDLSNPGINDIEITEEFTSYISRFHATLEYSPDQQKWFIRDGQWLKKNGKFGWYNSTNGVLVNSKKIDENGHPLTNGDIITLGDTTIRFENP